MNRPSYFRYLLKSTLLILVLAFLFGTFAGMGRYWTSVVLALVLMFGLSMFGDNSGLSSVPDSKVKLQSMGLLLGLALVILGHAYAYQQTKQQVYESVQEEGSPLEVFDRHIQEALGDEQQGGFRGYFSYLAAQGYSEKYRGAPRHIEGVGVWIFWLVQTGMFLLAGYGSGNLADTDVLPSSTRVHSRLRRDKRQEPEHPREGPLPNPPPSQQPSEQPIGGGDPTPRIEDKIDDKEELSQRFFWACRDGEFEQVEQMLARGVDKEFRSGDFNETPLISAARFQRYQVFERLLAAGANPLAVDDWQHSVLHNLANDDRGFRYLASMVELGVDIDAPGRTGRTPLFNALSRAATMNATFFLDHGCNVHHVADRGESVLDALLAGDPSRWRGKEAQRVDLLRHLLKMGVDPRSPDDYGRTPMHLVALSDSAELVSVMKRAGVSFEVADKRGTTPLQGAVHSPKTRDNAQALLNAGAYLDIFSAVCLGRHDQVACLLQEDPSRACFAPEAPLGSVLSRAVHDSDQRMVELLLEHGADPTARATHDTVLHCAIEHHLSLDLVVLLVEHGANVDGLGSNGLPPLAAAAYLERPDIVRYLLSRGADPNHHWNERGQTVLRAAKSPEIRSLLLAAGATDS